MVLRGSGLLFCFPQRFSNLLSDGKKLLFGFLYCQHAGKQSVRCNGAEEARSVPQSVRVSP